MRIDFILLEVTIDNKGGWITLMSFGRHSLLLIEWYTKKNYHKKGLQVFEIFFIQIYGPSGIIDSH